MSSQLYMIATPIGNLEDLTVRARRLFQELPVFFAEDSREFKKLLNLLNIAVQDKRIYSYSSHNMKEATEDAIRILKEGRSIGFVSDRGTPGVSDPGAHLVARAFEESIQVVPVPGASAVSALLSVSGHLDGTFLFQGFLPTTNKMRDQLFNRVKRDGVALCFYEAPHRIRETLGEIQKHFPSGRVLLGRELTKVFENVSWVSLENLSTESVPEQGEYTCLLDPGNPAEEQLEWKEAVVLRSLSEKEWSKKIAERYEVAASDVYNALQQLKPK